MTKRMSDDARNAIFARHGDLALNRDGKEYTVTDLRSLVAVQVVEANAICAVEDQNAGLALQSIKSCALRILAAVDVLAAQREYAKQENALEPETWAERMKREATPILAPGNVLPTQKPVFWAVALLDETGKQRAMRLSNDRHLDPSKACRQCYGIPASPNFRFYNMGSSVSGMRKKLKTI